MALKFASVDEPILIERPLVGYRLLETSMSLQNPDDS